MNSVPERRSIDEARRLGRQSGEALEDRLREEERYERSRALASAASEGPSRSWQSADLERLAEFQQAVLNSRSWRFLQRLRALVGRAW